MQEAEAMARVYKERLMRDTDRSQAIEQKLRAVREKAEQLARGGKGEQAKKLMKEAEAKTRELEDQLRLRNARSSPGTPSRS